MDGPSRFFADLISNARSPQVFCCGLSIGGCHSLKRVSALRRDTRRPKAFGDSEDAHRSIEEDRVYREAHEEHRDGSGLREEKAFAGREP